MKRIEAEKLAVILKEAGSENNPNFQLSWDFLMGEYTVKEYEKALKLNGFIIGHLNPKIKI